MIGSQDAHFKKELKQLIIEACDLDVGADEISDDAPLFGPDSTLSLDSIDALQISVAIQNKYQIVITDSKEMRRVMLSINTFADFLQPE